MTFQRLSQCPTAVVGATSLTVLPTEKTEQRLMLSNKIVVYLQTVLKSYFLYVLMYFLLTNSSVMMSALIPHKTHLLSSTPFSLLLL